MDHVEFQWRQLCQWYQWQKWIQWRFIVTMLTVAPMATVANVTNESPLVPLSPFASLATLEFQMIHALCVVIVKRVSQSSGSVRSIIQWSQMAIAIDANGAQPWRLWPNGQLISGSGLKFPGQLNSDLL